MFIVVATDLPLFDSRLAFLCYHIGYRGAFQTIICHTTIRHLERTVTVVVWKSGLPLPFLFYLYLCRCFFATRLWIHTSEAIAHGNQNQATNEKCILEDEQRKEARERKAKMEEWIPRFFERNLLTGGWIYKYAE